MSHDRRAPLSWRNGTIACNERRALARPGQGAASANYWLSFRVVPEGFDTRGLKAAKALLEALAI